MGVRTDMDGPIELGGGGVGGHVELVSGVEHFERVVLQGMLKAKVSLDIATADFKAMLVPTPSGFRGRGAESIVSHLVKLADKGVEVRVLHAGVPSGPALRVLAQFCRRKDHGAASAQPVGSFVVRRCPRLHAKTVIVDAAAMYLGSANLTGAGLGAKSPKTRNFEWGVWTESSELVDAVLDEFNELWEGMHCENCGRKDVCPVPLEEPRLG